MDSVCDIKDIESDVMHTVPEEQIKSFYQYDTSRGTLVTEAREKITNIASDLVGNEEIDFSRLFASAKQRNPESIRKATMNIDRTVRIPSVEAVRGLRSTSFVSNETELAAALADSTVTIIIITVSFPLTYTHSINRSLVFMTLGNSYTITAASGEEHFMIQNQSSPISVTFSNVVLDGNSLGGGIVINNSYVTINGANIQHCYDSAISANNNARDPVTNVIQESGSLTINGGSFTYNLIDDGNTISSVGPISIYGATISHNNGNGVLALNLDESGSTAYFESVSICDNETESGGGGLHLLFYSVVITGQENIKSNILRNTAQQSGGGVLCYMCDTEISHTNIDGNTLAFVEQNGRSTDPTAVGGAGIMNVGSLSLENSEVLGNTGDCDFGFGVGIYALNPAAVLNNYDPDDYPWLSEAFTVTDSTISGNGCEWATGADPFDRSMNGGGIAVIGLKPTLTKTEISENEALIGGGALLFYVYDEDDLGPQDDPVIHFSGITVEDNAGKLAGGGIAMIGPDREDGDDDVVPASIKCKLQLEKNVENNNENPVETLTTISGNTSRYGAGITVFSVEVTVKDGTVVQNNYADSSFTPFVSNDWPNWACAGGGVLLVQQSKLDLLNGKILSNTTLKTESQQSAGAGVYAMGLSTIIINGAVSQVNENGTDVQIDANHTGSTTHGGGIYTEQSVLLMLANGMVDSNKAGTGAGIESNGKCIISGGSIESNESTASGGGVYAAGMLTISGGSIACNVAGDDGGGVYACSTTVISNGSFCFNWAYGNGGCMFLKGFVTMSSGSIEGNEAMLNGGGVYIEGTGTVINLGCEIRYNSAIVYYGGGVFVEQGGNYTEINPPTTDGFCHDNIPDDVYFE